MHGSGIDSSVSSGLGLYFLCFGLMNAYYTYRQLVVEKKKILGGLWLLFTLYLFGTSIDFYRGSGWILPAGFRDAIDNFMGPVSYFVLSVAGFAAVLYYRRFFVKPLVAWSLLNASIWFIGISMTDPDFRAIVAKPDNVPITMLIYSVGFTTWVYLKRAVENDDRGAAGSPPEEAVEKEKVLTWPDLVYEELLAMVIFTVGLLVWSICLKAPLEPPASTTEIPNPSKAPWYFLGLQEMLVYFDPWLAGVVLPTYIIIGLCAIPYLDYNKKGNGYYTFMERPFAVITFLFGFVVLWVTLIVLGTFLRGPNWNFFGPYEYWSPYKTVALTNINLSDWFWVILLGTNRPEFKPLLLAMVVRELPGILLILGYFGVLPLIMAKTFMREMFIKMGLVRFMTMANILLMMAFLPVKMILRWTLNLKYLVYMPEIFFNI